MPRAGDCVGGYRLLAPIRQGGMAAVFVARGPAPDGGPLACKILLPHLRGQAQGREFFFAESRTLESLSHPGIVQVVDAGEDAGVPFIVMEHLLGETLDDVRAARPDLAAVDVHAALAILAQIAAALASVHAARAADGGALGIVHRDVSPQNIHVGYDGVVKLLDFGIADFRARQRLTQTGELRGKLGYLAPEQITRARPVGQAADVFALGVVARELLTGRALFVAADEASTLWNVTAMTVPPTADVCPALADSVAHALDACLLRDPEARPRARDLAGVLSATLPGSATACVRRFVEGHLAEAHARARARLQAALATPSTLAFPRDGEGSPSHGISRTPLTAPPRRRWRWPAAVATGAALAAVGVLALRVPEPRSVNPVASEPSHSAVPAAAKSEGPTAKPNSTSEVSVAPAGAENGRSPGSARGTRRARVTPPASQRGEGDLLPWDGKAPAQGPGPLMKNPYR
jgi:serine/threonine-protein kinase